MFPRSGRDALFYPDVGRLTLFLCYVVRAHALNALGDVVLDNLGDS
jgi:hypothetical protein